MGSDGRGGAGLKEGWVLLVLVALVRGRGGGLT